MNSTLQEDVAHFEAALTARPLDYETLITAIRNIKLPASPDADLSNPLIFSRGKMQLMMGDAAQRVAHCESFEHCLLPSARRRSSNITNQGKHKRSRSTSRGSPGSSKSHRFQNEGIPEDADALTRLFRGCYRILDFKNTGFGARLRQEVGSWCAGHLEACAGEQIEHVLYDPSAQSRAWIKERINWHVKNNLEVPEDYLENDLPPEPTIPWDEQTARDRVGPLLDYWQGELPKIPTAHFNLAWKVMHDGYPIFRSIMNDWMRNLERRGLGFPGTMAAFTKADELLALAGSDTPLPWAACERDLVPLLKAPHPMVVGGTARALGAFYAEDGFPDAPDAPSLKDMLENLAALDEHRAIACGGFVCGFDADFSGLYALQSDKRLEGTNFALDNWILKIVAHDDYEPYLPNAQPTWFYIHEYYDTRPEMVMTFIDVGRSWLAMMCATEVDGNVAGMKPVLERLVKDADPDIAKAAKQHLTEHYA